MTDFREIATGLRFPEGPIAMPDGSVILVEIAASRLSRILPDGTISVVAETGGGPNGAAIGPEEELAEDIVFGLTSTAGAGIMSDPALGASVSMIGLQTHDYLWDARKGSKNPLSNKIEAPPGYYDEDDHPKVKIGNKMLGVGDKVIDLEFGHQGDIISWGNTKDPVVLFQTGVSPHEGHKPIIDKVRASKLKPGL